MRRSDSHFNRTNAAWFGCWRDPREQSPDRCELQFAPSRIVTGVAMHDMEWRHVPVGLEADRWVTRPCRRTVLVVIHTVMFGQRLMEVVRLIATDARVQVVFTTAPDVFGAGVTDFLRALGGIVVSWLQATQTRFDLALAASYGSIDELHSPLIVVPHGAGDAKFAAPFPHQPVAARAPYGLDAQRLMRDGRVIPAAVVLPHQADLARLARTCPDAVPAATVAGDPCLDTILASIGKRPGYRDRLGVGRERQLVVVTSTWGQGSWFGAAPHLLERLLTELPSDAFRVVALLHPNVWYGHGRWQIQAWLADCLDRGLGLVPPEADWRAAMIAADWILADHGSLGVYGTAVNVPILVSGTAAPDLDPDSAQGLLAAAAPPLRPAAAASAVASRRRLFPRSLRAGHRKDQLRTRAVQPEHAPADVPAAQAAPARPRSGRPDGGIPISRCLNIPRSRS